MGHAPPEIIQFLSRPDNRVTILAALTISRVVTWRYPVDLALGIDICQQTAVRVGVESSAEQR